MENRRFISKDSRERKRAFISLGMLAIAAMTLLIGTDFDRLIRNKGRMVAELYGTDCLDTAEVADNFLDRNLKKEALSNGLPAALAAYFRSHDLNAGVFEAWCQELNQSWILPISTQRTSAENARVVPVAVSEHGSKDELITLENIPVPGDPDVDLGGAVQVPRAAVSVGEQPAPTSVHSVLDNLYLVSQGDTDYFLIPGFSTAAGMQLMADLGMNRLPRRMDGTFIEMVPGISVTNISQMQYETSLDRPDHQAEINGSQVIILNQIMNTTVLEDHDFYDESEKFDTYTGEKYQRGEIGNDAVYLVEQAIGSAKLMSGQQLRESPHRLDFHSALYFTWPLIVDGRTINIPGYDLPTHLEISYQDKHYILDTLPDIVERNLESGHLAAKGLFATDQGLYIVKLPPGILVSRELWQQFLQLFEQHYGQVHNAALGDLDYGSYVNFPPKPGTLITDDPTIQYRSQVATFRP